MPCRTPSGLRFLRGWGRGHLPVPALRAHHRSKRSRGPFRHRLGHIQKRRGRSLAGRGGCNIGAGIRLAP
ncbi:hypothetical protein D0N87_25630 [Pseudomonas sp. ATCC 13867]|nr:hypothetical protein D0N87_25630 [Pseudomonas sp. ATCC 13867]